MEEKLYFKNGEGLILCGVLTKPKKEISKCIVLCHGIGADKDEAGVFTQLAKRLSKVGFNVFRFDFRGHGESEGNSIDMTVSGEKNDLEVAIKFMQNLEYSKFGILGASFGGGAVSFFTSEHTNIVKALVLMYALVDYQSILHPRVTWSIKKFGEEQMKKLEKNGFISLDRNFKIGKKLFDDIKKLEPWKALTRISTPILFVHGDKDTYVPYEDSVKYSKLLKNARLVTLHGSDHGFGENKEYAEIFYKATINFFLKHL